ncbi:hypothetical protein P154DRAFT_530786 [Amniculicola lignicola CBS 123094]|uniref:Uncharacterized protein n=1 Tax=Amniculicola lignicola CBS 123094 TaxID=1392246 RepID=A0A6A5WVX6_9PLEO|nr:hypothetical protein P154DRAFT_530786 [Amniculicola lignicola CBS 123094]
MSSSTRKSPETLEGCVFSKRGCASPEGPEICTNCQKMGFDSLVEKAGIDEHLRFKVRHLKARFKAAIGNKVPPRFPCATIDPDYDQTSWQAAFKRSSRCQLKLADVDKICPPCLEKNKNEPWFEDIAWTDNGDLKFQCLMATEEYNYTWWKEKFGRTYNPEICDKEINISDALCFPCYEDIKKQIEAATEGGDSLNIRSLFWKAFDPEIHTVSHHYVKSEPIRNWYK